MIELKMTRMKEHADWEEKQKLLMNFIQTKSKPHIYFLPKILNEQNKKLLETCKTNIESNVTFLNITYLQIGFYRNFVKTFGSNFKIIIFLMSSKFIVK